MTTTAPTPAPRPCPGSGDLDTFSTGRSIAGGRYGSYADGTPRRVPVTCNFCGFTGTGRVVFSSGGHRYSSARVRMPNHVRTPRS